jgi:hypothetical protein
MFAERSPCRDERRPDGQGTPSHVKVTNGDSVVTTTAARNGGIRFVFCNLYLTGDDRSRRQISLLEEI